MLAASWGVRLAGVPCCAVELEQEIERLEAEAGRDDELVNFSLAGAARDLPLSEHMSVDDVRNMQVAHMSDTESDDSEEEDEERVARISQNALLVSQCGKTLLPGAWRGCAKSPLCDREDRHRGLCNHRATIPGPAACRSLRAQQQEQDDEQDTSSMDQGEVAAYSDVLMQCVEAQQASGGHSHTCQAPCAQGDEREVDSAVHTGGMQGCSHQHVWGAAHQEQEAAAAAAAMAAIIRSSSGEDDLFWAGNAGQLAAAELFSIPPAYQPRVKDLTAPGGPCLLSMDSDMSDISTPLAAPMAVPAEQHTVAAGFESACSDCSDHTNTVACAPNSGSAPSSPSCASADLAAFGPFQPQAVATHLADTAAAAPPAAASSPCTPDSTAAMAAAFAVAEHSEAAAVAAEAAAAAAPVGLAAAGAAAAAKHAVQDSTRMEAHAAAAVAPIAATGSSTQAGLEHAAAEAATAEAVAAAAAAAALVASGLASPPAAASPRAAPAAAAATVAQAPAAPQRPPRIRSKPSKSVMKAAAAVVEPSSSPKSKKRPATSRTPGSGGHCCTSCGAVSTPVWRAGPAGPKTLCNACGVRYMKVAKRK